MSDLLSALKNLVEQIELSEAVDKHGHKLSNLQVLHEAIHAEEAGLHHGVGIGETLAEAIGAAFRDLHKTRKANEQ